MIDWVRVAELQNEICEEDFEDVITLFLQEADEVAVRLVSLGDVPASAHDLHFLKGSALNLGFRDLAHLCHVGEKGVQQSSKEIARLYIKSRSAFLRNVGSGLKFQDQPLPPN